MVWGNSGILHSPGLPVGQACTVQHHALKEVAFGPWLQPSRKWFPLWGLGVVPLGISVQPANVCPHDGNVLGSLTCTVSTRAHPRAPQRRLGR